MGNIQFHAWSGLCNAPSTFQATMNELLSPYLNCFVIVFFDDILIFSKTFEEHIRHLEMVFCLLQQGQFFLKYSKCVFGESKIEYLGHIISGAGSRFLPKSMPCLHGPHHLLRSPYVDFSA